MRILIIDGESGKKIRLRLPTSILLSNMSASIISRAITKHLNSEDGGQNIFSIGSQKNNDPAEYLEIDSKNVTTSAEVTDKKEYVSFADAVASQHQETADTDHWTIDNNENNDITKLEFVDGETYYRNEEEDRSANTDLVIKPAEINALENDEANKTLRSKRRNNTAILKNFFKILKDVKKAHNGKFRLVEVLSGDGDVVIIEL